MGTRADFYIGIGKDAEWLGSIAWDGGDIPDGIWDAPDAETFQHQVSTFLASRDDATSPSQGWPWPWNDSGITDCAYAFANGVVYGASGDYFLPAAEYHKRMASDEDVPERDIPGAIPTDFPDMSARRNFTLGKRSGVIVIGS